MGGRTVSFRGGGASASPLETGVAGFPAPAVPDRSLITTFEPSYETSVPDASSGS
jgi:hypothetical protein